MTKHKRFLARLEDYGIDPRYALGQNFIYDEELLDDLAASCKLEGDARVIEIGSGFGTLTEAMLRYLPEGALLTYEIDRQLEQRLGDLEALYPQLEILMEDASKADFAQAAESLTTRQVERGQRVGELHMVANLPYYITTELMEKALTSIPYAKSMHFMVQAEVWDRIKALPTDGKVYGPLAILCHLYGDIEKQRDLPAAVFHPAPRVNSIFVGLYRRDDGTRNPLFSGDGVDFVSFVTKLLLARRKTIGNNLQRSGMDEVRQMRILEKLDVLGYDRQIRAEKLTPQEWAELYYA